MLALFVRAAQRTCIRFMPLAGVSRSGRTRLSTPRGRPLDAGGGRIRLHTTNAEGLTRHFGERRGCHLHYRCGVRLSVPAPARVAPRPERPRQAVVPGLSAPRLTPRGSGAGRALDGGRLRARLRLCAAGLPSLLLLLEVKRAGPPETWPLHVDAEFGLGRLLVLAELGMRARHGCARASTASRSASASAATVCCPCARRGEHHSA